MRIIALVGVLAASACWAQEPAAHPQPPSSAQAQAPSASQNQVITIPAGTRIPLALASPVTAKARPGDTVRAATMFPITVDTQLAIPVGTYVEGVMNKLTKGGRSGPTMLMHFTRLLYANGYSVAVDGANMQAKALPPVPASPEVAAFAGVSGPGFALAPPQLPTLPPMPKVGPSIGTVVGVSVAVTVVGTAALVILSRHHGGSAVLFDTGWQFEMVLQSPLSVDAANVANAVAFATPAAP